VSRLSRFKTRLLGWARALKRDVMTLWFCARHPGTPWWLRLLVVALAAYALSPIDLIPDFIPVLGYLDDLLLLPLGIWLVVRLLPAAVLAECREQAAQWAQRNEARPVSRVAAAVVLLIWIALASATGYWLLAPERG